MDMTLASPVARILGLDVGEKRIGLALSDPMGFTAGPLGVLERKDVETTANAVKRLVEKHQAQAIVVGLPLTLRGSKGPQAQRVHSFVLELRKRLLVPIIMEDERLTTVQGERALREAGASRKQRKAAIDQVAAQLILQAYLDRNRNSALLE